MMAPNLTSDRLFLRPFRPEDLDAFAALHAEPQVMADLGGPITRKAAQVKLEGYMACDRRFGYSRLAVFCDGTFAGYTGVMHRDAPGHPLGPHNEVGWRLLPLMWGQGIATEAARLSLQDMFKRRPGTEVFCYALPDNIRSHAVMARLGFERAPELDFTEDDPDYGAWRGLVWRVPYADFAGGIE